MEISVVGFQDILLKKLNAKPSACFTAVSYCDLYRDENNVTIHILKFKNPITKMDYNWVYEIKSTEKKGHRFVIHKIAQKLHETTQSPFLNLIISVYQQTGNTKYLIKRI